MKQPADSRPCARQQNCILTLVILDLSLPDLNGMEAARQICHGQSAELIIYSHYDSPALVREAFSHGVHGYVLKSDACQDLLAAVETVGEHKTYLSSSLRQSLPDLGKIV